MTSHDADRLCLQLKLLAVNSSPIQSNVSASFEGSQDSMHCLSGKSSLKVKTNMEHWRSDILVVGTRSEFPDSNCRSATSCTTNLTWTGLESNPGFRREMPARNCLSHGTAFKRRQSELCVNTQSVPRSKHTPSLLYKPVS